MSLPWIMLNLPKRLLLLPLLACTACVKGMEEDIGPTDALYLCEGGAGFSVQESGSTALVRFSDGEYRLERRASSIGRKFSSATATLIIDGNAAVFVAEDRLDLDGCRSAGAGNADSLA